MAFNRSLLNKIFQSDNDGIQYLVFKNAGKIWILPKESLCHAFDMYQPTTFKGKTLKKITILFKNWHVVLKRLGTEVELLSVNAEILNRIKETIKKDKFYVAGYIGDDSSDQNNKVTLQVFDDKEILCFVKLTDNDEVAKSYDWEIDKLKELEEKRVTKIPKVLDRGECNGVQYWIQSTEKEFGEKVKLKFGKKQLEFITEIVIATEKKCKYEDTDFYKYIEYLKKHTSDYTDEQKQTLDEAIEIIENELQGKECECSFSHGDFTPWNVYYKNYKINAFDFEYSKDVMPQYIDAFHFMTQMSLLGQNNEVGKTVHIYRKKKKLMERYMLDVDFSYLCYLVYIVSFYHDRAKDETEVKEGQSVQWIGIMEYLIERNISKNGSTQCAKKLHI